MYNTSWQANRYNTFKMIKYASYNIIGSVKNQVRSDMLLSTEWYMSHGLTIRQSNRSTEDNL